MGGGGGGKKYYPPPPPPPAPMPKRIDDSVRLKEEAELRRFKGKGRQSTILALQPLGQPEIGKPTLLGYTG